MHAIAGSIIVTARIRVADASAAAFVSSQLVSTTPAQLTSTLRVPVERVQGVAITSDTVDAPSPPPPPTAPTQTPDLALSHEAANQHTSSSMTADDSNLSSELMWTIILAAIGGITCLGCVAAFWCGARLQSKRHIAVTQIGRWGRTSNQEHTDVENAAPPLSRQVSGRDTPINREVDHSRDQYLLELGMSLERQRSGTPSGNTMSPPMATPVATPATSLPTQDGVQAALAIINDVRALAESLSPCTAAATKVDPSRSRTSDRVPSTEGDFDTRGAPSYI